MQKNASFSKFICFTTAVSFSISSLWPHYVKANPLAPLSFKEMYSLAQKGDVEALRASVRRGLNIDVVTPDGDTGLCIAAKNHDSYTYNAFRAAGANPHHPCVQNISEYEKFVNSSNTVPITAVPREAYSSLGKESYSISPITWWVLGGLAVTGGVVALLVGHHGGGSSSDSGSGGGNQTEEYNSLGAIIATDGNTSKTATDAATNSSKIKLADKTSDEIKSIDLIKDAMTNTKYLNQALLAKNGGSYTNDAKGILEIGTGNVAMTALKKAEILNEGYIKVDASNASIAMVASESSDAINNASGVIDGSSTLGIDLNFSGDDATKTIVGMYADTNSIALNNGDIRATATKTSADGETTTSIKGNLIGMEAMILNTGKNVQDNLITLTNNSSGKINLSAGDSTETTVYLMTVGIGSFIDNDFLNGSANINRAESAVLTNNGTINIGYTGKYQVNNDNPLRKGTGGIIGMRADANTTATNAGSGTIVLTLSDYNNSGNSTTTGGTPTGAGMQSVHGANLINNGIIKIASSATNSNNLIHYGMIAVEGYGTVSGLYTNTKQILDNYGTINIEASNSYGMASYNGGTLNNNLGAIIVLGKDMGESSTQDADTQYVNNVGMYGSSDSTIVALNNYGTIDVFSYQSTAMQNDFAGGTDIVNEGTINIRPSATDSKVFKGYYSRIRNNGIINYSLSKDGTPSEKGSAEDPFNNYELSLEDNIITTQSSASSSSTTEAIYNNNNIIVNGSSFVSAMSVETVRGMAENNGTITLNPQKFDTEGNSVGMYANDSTITAAGIYNKGTINTNFYMSAAMASDSTQNAAVVNYGNIIAQKEYSLGMYASNKSVMKNYKNITMKASNSVAMYTVGNSNLSNEQGSTITIISDNDGELLENVYGLYSKGSSNKLENLGGITIKGSSGAAIFSSGEATDIVNKAYIGSNISSGIYVTGSDTTINNSGEISGITKYGIFASGTGTKITNSGYISGNSMTAGIYASGDELTINNTYEGEIYGAAVYGIYGGSKSTITNSGTIGTQNSMPSYGIYAQSGSNVTNGGTIYASEYGIYVKAGESSNSGNNQNSSEETIVTNNGTIGSSDAMPAYGIYASIASENDKISVINNGTIYASTAGIHLNYEYSPATEEAKIAEQTALEEQNRTIVEGNVVLNDEYGKTFETAHNSSGSAGLTSAAASSPVVRLLNNGTYRSNTALNFSTNPQVSYALGQNGSYQAASLSGVVIVANKVVQDGFASVYTAADALIGEDNGVSVVSESYMYDADTNVNDNGNLDVVLTMKSFTNLTDNESLAAFLNNNYKQENGSQTFNYLKSASSDKSFNMALNNKFALNFVPNLAKQNFDNERIIGSQVNDDLLQNTIETNRVKFSGLTYKNNVDGKHNVSSYKDKVAAIYGFSDKFIGNNLRIGFGLNLSHLNSDFDDGSSRYNNIMEIYTPLIINNNFLIKPKAGFGRGHYRRTSENGFNKAQTKEYYYGLDAIAEHSFDLGFMKIKPSVGLLTTGMYVDDVSESNNGMKLKSKNMISAMSVAGFDVNKKFTFNNNQTITLSAGGKYYHEFGNEYAAKATLNDMHGYYKIKSNRLNRDFGIIKFKSEYGLAGFSVSASANIPVESKHNTYYMLNLGYNF